MRNAGAWQPSKYVLNNGRLAATRDPNELGVGSRLIAGLVARVYDEGLRRHASGKLLDLGCGKVPLFAAYRDLVSEVQCIDWPNSLHGSQFVDKHCDLTGRTPYSDEAFDTIVLSDVLEHLPEPKNCWREMNRLLAPGGRILLNVPFYYQIHEQPHDYYRYTEFALRRFAEETGFQVEDLRPIGGAVEVLVDITSKLLASARLKPLAALIQSSSLAFVKTGLGARLSARTGKTFPLGYFMVASKSDRKPEASTQ